MKATTADGYQLLHEGSIALADAEAAGIRIDMKRLEGTIASTAAQIKALEEEIRHDEVYQVWRKSYGTRINLGSRKQLGHVLFDVMNYEDPNKNKKAGWDRDSQDEESRKMDKGILIQLDIPFLRKYERIEKLKKLLKTYLKGILRETMDGYVHAMYNLHTVRTYRGSCDSPNIQNIPVRDPEIGAAVRNIFIARKNCHLVEVDFAGIEVRAAACYHKDPTMLKYLKDPTTDMHRDMAMQIYKLRQEQISKKIRYCAKNMFVFPEFYGDWYKSCCQQLWNAVEQLDLKLEDGTSLRKHLKSKGLRELGECDPKEKPVSGTFENHLKKVESNFWGERFSVYAEWKKDWYNKYLNRGYFDLLTGFRCEGVFKRNDVINYPVQGIAFHFLLWSLIQLNKQLKKKKMQSRVVGQIHDSILGDVHKDELHDYLHMAHEIISVGLAQHWEWINVPLEVEMEVCPLGGTWFDKKPVNLAAI